MNLGAVCDGNYNLFLESVLGPYLHWQGSPSLFFNKFSCFCKLELLDKGIKLKTMMEKLQIFWSEFSVIIKLILRSIARPEMIRNGI